MGGSDSKAVYNKIQDALGVTIDENNKKLYNEDMNSKPVVYLDMDGVLADFFGGVEKMYGVQHWKELSSEKTRNKKGMVLTLALSYGSRREIIEIGRAHV